MNTDKPTLEKVSEAAMRFMRGKYVLDEVGDGKDGLEFRENGVRGPQGVGETFMSVRIREDRYDFHIDGECILVADLEAFEAVKRLALVKKEPNRKPFPKEQAIYGDCGHRCDLCIHYNGNTTYGEESREELKERVRRVYCPDSTKEEFEKGFFLCSGCANAWPDDPCAQKKCVAEKGIDKCVNCQQYPCDKATAGLQDGIQPRSILADDVTWAILPYVPEQYGN